MQCPKCGAEQDSGNEICDRCGIVFEKYYKYHPRPGIDPPATIEARAAVDAGDLSLRSLIFPAQENADWLSLAGRGLLFLLLAWWSWRLIPSSISGNVAGAFFLHNVNLVFHEAGHVVFGFFGQFIGSLGGTLGQLLIPLLCFGALLVKTRDPFGGSVALWWFGENFLDIAPYIADARAGQLPLLGGNYGHSAPYGFHDWEYLLTETGLLQLDGFLAGLSHVTGSVFMLLALSWGGILLYRQYQAVRR